MSFAKGLFNLFIAFIVSIYMTIDKFILKNAGKRLVLAIFNENFSYRVLRTLKDCHNIFSGFIIGKSIDSLIIGLLAFVAMTILKLPYTVLISVIIGVTNMIPYFGPIIGAVPGAFILFIVSPTKCLIFIIMVFVLQQFDGLILGPKILGESTGVSSTTDFIFHHCRLALISVHLECSLEFVFCYSSIFDRKLGRLSVV